MGSLNTLRTRSPLGALERTHTKCGNQSIVANRNERYCLFWKEETCKVLDVVEVLQNRNYEILGNEAKYILINSFNTWVARLGTT